MAALDDFLSFLQGASNSAASAVSAPVDGINWALGKVGVPVSKKPVGGSEWLKELGFTAEPQNKTAGLLGEAVGGVLPIVAQAKAPQIAAKLNWAGQNLTAPRTLNPQAGVVLFRAGNKYGMTADTGGPTFFSTTKAGAKPFARNGEVRAVDIQPQSVFDAARGDGIKLYQEFLKETKHPAGYGSTARPYWTAEHDLAKWLKAKGKHFDAVVFDEPTGVPSYAIYSKDLIP